MLTSLSVHLPALFHPSFIPISRHLFLQFSFRFFASTHMGKMVNSSTRSSSGQQQLKPVADSAVSKDPMQDEQLAAKFDENEGYMMFGSIPSSLPGKNVKNCSIRLSSSNHLTSPTATTTRFEHKKYKRKTRIDLSVQSSGNNCCVPSSNSEGSEKIATINLNTPHHESPQGSESWKKNSASVNRPYNKPSNSNYAMVGHKMDASDSNSKLKPYENSGYSHTRKFSTANKTLPHDESPQGNESWKKKSAYGNKSYNTPSNSNHAAVGHSLDASISTAKFKPYDICFHGKRNPYLIGNISPGESKEIGIDRQEEWTKGGILRPGMVLLKHFLTHDEQVEIVKVCRDLGRGPGGFYQPGYANGAKLRLKMMCLGMDWDPQTYKYGKTRVIDGSKPPSIPNHFSEMVKRSIQVAHSLIKKESRVRNVEDELPSMTPDLCIVNFYTNNGKLGLHQDRDESRESLRKGLPVVSFSIGDSAEFLYGDERDVVEAESVVLESGDVLIFGGESRHVFHGVSSVLQKSAPKELLKDTCLCPGRLNLTFRQY